MMEMEIFLTRLAAASLIIMAYSFLYKENYLFRFAEHTTLGISIGYAASQLYKSLIESGIAKIQGGATIYIIPLLIGLLMYGQLSSRTRWTSRYPLAIAVGSGLGLSVRGEIESHFIAQIIATSAPMFAPGDALGTFNSLLMVIGTLTSVSFFVFTREHKGSWNIVTRIGRLFLVIGFGALFANTIMTRFAWFLGPWVENVVKYPGYIPAVIGIIVIFVHAGMSRFRTQSET